MTTISTGFDGAATSTAGASPPGASGAVLTRAAALFGRIARCEDPTLRDGLDPAAATVIHDVLLALVAGEAAALARLPGSLGKRLEAAILREPER